MVLEQVGRRHVCVLERVVGLNEAERRLLVDVGALALHLQVGTGQQMHRLPPAGAALLAAAHPTVGRLEAAVRPALPPGVEDALAMRQGGEGRDSPVYAGLLARGVQRLCGHVGAREADIPPVGFP